MKVSLLASGSKGNCCYVETKNYRFLIDAGMTCAYIEKQLLSIEKSMKNIDAVFITHTHTDHINGLKTIIKKYNPIIYVSEKMYAELSILMPSNNYVILGKELLLDSLKVVPVKTSHDADDSLGYIFEEDNHSLVYITDTGYINIKNHSKLINKNVYVLESNHDVDLLMTNPKYPYHLKQRILGDKGHLSNKDCSYYLSKFISSDTKCIVLAHLSEHNNTPKLAKEQLLKTLQESDKYCEQIIIATQKERTELVEV